MSEEIKRVLVATDDNLWNESAKLSLSEKGMEVDIAQNGADAEDKLMHNHYIAAILELYMSIKSAVDVLKSVRAQDIQTPILVVSNTKNEDDKKKLLTEGASGYLIKPNININSLPDLLERYIN